MPSAKKLMNWAASTASAPVVTRAHDVQKMWTSVQLTFVSTMASATTSQESSSASAAQDSRGHAAT